MKTRIVTCRGESKQPLKVFLRQAHSGKDTLKALFSRLTTLAPCASTGEDGVDRYAWLDKEKLLPGQVPGQDWELEIRKAVREAIDV